MFAVPANWSIVAHGVTEDTEVLPQGLDDPAYTHVRLTFDLPVGRAVRTGPMQDAALKFEERSAK